MLLKDVLTRMEPGTVLGSTAMCNDRRTITFVPIIRPPPAPPRATAFL